MANAYRNADLSLAIYRPLRTGYRFTVKIGHLFLVLHKCNIWIYFLLLLTQVDFFGTTFYFLESRKFSHYFYFLKSRIFGMYFYFLESSKEICFWQHWKAVLFCTKYQSLYLGFDVIMYCDEWLCQFSQSSASSLAITVLKLWQKTVIKTVSYTLMCSSYVHIVQLKLDCV